MNYKGEITPLLCEREAKLPLEGEFTLYALVSAEVANFVVSSKETIHKSLTLNYNIWTLIGTYKEICYI